MVLKCSMFIYDVSDMHIVTCCRKSAFSAYLICYSCTDVGKLVSILFGAINGKPVLLLGTSIGSELGLHRFRLLISISYNLGRSQPFQLK